MDKAKTTVLMLEAGTKQCPVHAEDIASAKIGYLWKVEGEDEREGDALALLQIEDDGSRTLIRITVENEEDELRQEVRQYSFNQPQTLLEVDVENKYLLNRPIPHMPGQKDIIESTANVVVGTLETVNFAGIVAGVFSIFFAS